MSTWYKNGDEHSDTFSSASGCDSIMHWSFQIGLTQHNVVNIDGCDSVYQNNIWFKQSSNYFDTLTTTSMCDSIVRYDIAIHPSYLDTVDINACDSFKHKTSTYYASDIISETYQSANGCDSTSSLNLVISPSSSTIRIDTFCKNDTVTLPDGKQVRLQSSGLYPYLYQNRFQCDSVVRRYMITKECPLCTVYFPNAISINGDFRNEGFKQVSLCSFKYYELKIFNRWGALIYQTTDPNAVWNGYVLDKKVPMTAYLYIATYLLDQPGATPTQQAGTVTVLR
jgi:gliding motility-associated-like protein